MAKKKRSNQPAGTKLNTSDRLALYSAQRFIGSSLEEKFKIRIPFDVYFQDPLVAKSNPELAFDENCFVPWEPGLGDGPTSARFAVVDYDAHTDVLAPPARWDQKQDRFLALGRVGAEVSRYRRRGFRRDRTGADYVEQCRQPIPARGAVRWGPAADSARTRYGASDQVDLGSEADDALRALADLEAETGNLARAREIARTLLDQVLAAEPHPENTLADAVDLSRLFASLAALDRRAGRADLASELDTRRLRLWQHWERKLSDNAFVVEQFAAARVGDGAGPPLPQQWSPPEHR